MTVEPGEGTPISSPQPPADPPASAAGAESTSAALQSMLSRAVEGQAGEQRELTNAVTDMRNQLLRLSQELAELRVRPAGDESSDAHNNAVTVEMREAVRFLSERLDGVTRMVAQRGEELADIRTALTAIDAHVRSQAETMGVLSSGLQALPSYGERVSVLQDNLQVLHRQLVGIEQAVGPANQDDKLGERLAAIEAAITPLGHQLNQISELGTAHAASLSDLQNASSQLEQSVSGVRESVSGIHESVAGVHDRIEPLASDVAAVGRGVNGLVEGSGASPEGDLDARITDSVTAAVRETEERLMAHVDEAVVALAQTLLRRRTPTAASDITGTPLTDLPTAEPAAPIVVPPAAAPEPDPAEPTTQWWEREIESPSAVEHHDTDEVDEAGAVDADAAAISDDDDDDDGTADVEVPPVDQWGASSSAAEPDRTDEPRVGVLDADDDEPDEAPLTDSPAEADDAAPWYAKLPPPLAGTAVDAPATEAWTPQTPPARDPADPTVSLEDGTKKRRWGRRK